MLVLSLHKLLLAFRRLLFGKPIIHNVLQSLLRRLAFLWSLLRPTWRLGETSRSTPDKPPNAKPPDAPPIPFPTVFTPDNESTVSLANISCSLYPYAYPPRNISRSSRNLGVHASRSSHNLAIASRHASRSSHNLAITSRNGSRSSHNLAIASRNASRSSHDLAEDRSVFGPGSLRAESVNEYTITYLSPEDPSNSPTTPHQGYSLSSHMLRPNSISSFPRGRRSRSASPGPSVAIPEGDVVIQLEDVVHAVPASHSKPALLDDRLFPLAPEHFRRYDRINRIPKKETKITVQPLQMDYSSHINPPGWTFHAHPEGVPYFYHAQKRIYTEANLYEEDFIRKANEDIATIEDFLTVHGIRLGPDVDLALDLNKEDGNIITDYYYADHDRRIIFFLDEFESSNLPAWSQVAGVNSLSHLRIEFEAQYWYHCQLYPTCLKVPLPLVNELRDIVMHAIGDSMTSPYSTVPYNLEDLYKILSLTNNLKENVGTQFGGSTSLLSRFMFVFVRQKFFDFHGQPCARLDRDQTVYEGVTERRTFLIKGLSPLLFNAPDVHLRNLEKMWVDGLMHKAVWLESIAKLNEEWQEFVLYATVILNANVAFLAIQSIDDSVAPYRSPTQVASYLSMIASIGSIILGLLLIRQNRTKEDGTADDALRFLSDRKHPKLGLEALAIVFSLPYALLMWGMVAFLAAFSLNCFQKSNAATRVLVGTAFLSICILITWSIWMSWEKEQGDTVNAPAAPVESDGDGSPKNPSQQNVRGSAPRWTWPNIFRKYSYDSGNTVV